MAKQTKRQSKKVGTVMKEYNKGTLKMGKPGPGKGPKVKKRKQALAIALSEAGISEPSKENKSSKRRTKGK